jgi:hypothetical protein
MTQTRRHAASPAQRHPAAAALRLLNAGDHLEMNPALGNWLLMGGAGPALPVNWTAGEFRGAA